jgi:beta-lactamase class D
MLSSLLLILILATVSSTPVDSADSSDIFTRYGVEGSFVLCPVEDGDCERINPGRCDERFIPASTFKVLNSMIALETGAIAGTDEVLTWDGRRHRIQSWNQDQDMEHAFQRSCVWFYQELARRIGDERMRGYLQKTAYGNASMGGGIDRFWLDGDLRISQNEQISLLRRLWKNELPFRGEVQNTVKRLMVLESGDNFTFSGKTGLGDVNDILYGWLVGFIERDGRAYCYALNIASPSMAMNEFAPLRLKIVRELLKERKLL